MTDPLKLRLFKRAEKDVHKAITLLTCAVLQLPDTAGSNLTSLIRQIQSTMELAEREVHDNPYVCRCCGHESLYRFGSDETICGPCHNGIHHNHEPKQGVRLPNG